MGIVLKTRNRIARLATSGVLFAFAAIMGVSVLTSQPAGASIFDDWYFNGDVSEGYFSNAGTWDWDYGHRVACGYSNGCPVLPNGDYSYEAINGGFRDGNNSIAQSIQRAHDLVGQLRAYNTNGDAWSQAGSGFIASSMLGYGSDNGNRTRSPSAAMWADIEARLVDRASKGRINWNVDYNSNGQDTYSRILYNTDGVYRWDIVYDGTYMTRNGIIIYNDNGTEAYKLWYLCANPVGSMSGLPVASYNLRPVISGTPNTSEGAQNVSLTPTISNDGPATSSNTQWQITTFRVNPGVTVPGAGNNNRTPVQHFANGATTIGSGTGNYSRGTSNISIGAQALGEYPVGTRICYALSVRPYNHTTTDWRHSTPFCVTIAKKPKVQIQGSDLIVGKSTRSNVVSSTTTKGTGADPRTYGSWTEYAAIASGTVTGFGSGAGYSGGAANSTFCNASLLTFTNAGSTSCSGSTIKGNYAINKLLPGVGSQLIAGSALTSQTVNLATLGNAVYSASGNVTINTSGIAKGRWVVINAPTSTVTITGNITYSGDQLQKISDIPQVVIIADNINIQGGVTNVDAWLVATGTTGNINTCSDVSAANQLRSGNCSNTLTVNGPVIARHLFLYRTAGSGLGAATGAPAEVFNLRPDAYLWATSYSASAGRIQTVSTKELPPRF